MSALRRSRRTIVIGHAKYTISSVSLARGRAAKCVTTWVSDWYGMGNDWPYRLWRWFYRWGGIYSISRFMESKSVKTFHGEQETTMSRYEGMDPEEYREELIAMGASEEEANAAVRDLNDK